MLALLHWTLRGGQAWRPIVCIGLYLLVTKRLLLLAATVSFDLAVQQVSNIREIIRWAIETIQIEAIHVGTMIGVTRCNLSSLIKTNH